MCILELIQYDDRLWLRSKDCREKSRPRRPHLSTVTNQPTTNEKQIADFDRFLDVLNNEAYLLKKGPRLYQASKHDCR